MGLPWPDEAGPAEIEAFDLAARRAAHWCWQPPKLVAPPQVRQADWVRNDIDRFILAKLEEVGLTPSPHADRATLIRRLTFDMIGLPPTPDEIDAFVNDTSPEAYEKLVDRLLASPHFGEKWGRHWLDLVRYAETLGHEFDFDIHEAWRYRDYVIRAFNDDVAYDQLLFEHLAGDLMESPRIDAQTGHNQSVQGTGWYWLGEQTHSPVDAKGHQSDVIANQIDVIGRAFQGITIACARCHDHKFDAISTQDYYAMYGVMQSSTWSPTPTNPPDQLADNAPALQDAGQAIERLVRNNIDGAQTNLSAYMVAASEVFRQTRGLENNAQRSARVDALCQELAQDRGLERAMLRRWVDVTFLQTHRDAQHPLHGWGIANHFKPEDMQRWWANQPARSREFFAQGNGLRTGDALRYDASDLQAGRAHGLAFGESSIVASGAFLPAAGHRAGIGQIAVFPGRSSARIANRFQGVFQTDVSIIEKRYVHVLAQGRGTFLNFVIDGFRVIRHPIYGPMRQQLDASYPRWYSVDLDKWQSGHSDLLIEMTDIIPANPGSGGSPIDAHGTIYRVVVSDQGAPPSPSFALVGLMDVSNQATVPLIAAEYERLIADAVAVWQSGQAPNAPTDHAKLALLSFLLDAGLLPLADTQGNAIDITPLVSGYRQTAQRVPLPQMVLASAETSPLDSPIFVRGSHLVLGDTAPRRFIEAMVGNDVASPAQGSGRLQIAQAITDPNNPLTARVAVNRLWHHLFGKGIVASVDNMGVLGVPPTHPELLDFSCGDVCTAR